MRIIIQLIVEPSDDYSVGFEKTVETTAVPAIGTVVNIKVCEDLDKSLPAEIEIRQVFWFENRDPNFMVVCEAIECDYSKSEMIEKFVENGWAVSFQLGQN